MFFSSACDQANRLMNEQTSVFVCRGRNKWYLVGFFFCFDLPEEQMPWVRSTNQW